MSEYKRLTKQKWSNEIDLTQELGYSYIYKRLYELENLLDNELLVELPCKVGDTVYEVFKEHGSLFIKESIIEKIVITENGGIRLKLSRNSMYETAVSSIGKTIFFTRKEAEAKLKKLQE